MGECFGNLYETTIPIGGNKPIGDCSGSTAITHFSFRKKEGSIGFNRMLLTQF